MFMIQSKIKRIPNSEENPKRKALSKWQSKNQNTSNVEWITTVIFLTCTDIYHVENGGFYLAKTLTI